MCRSRGAHVCRLICTVYIDIFAVDFMGPCSNCEIKNRENFRSAILTLASHQSQATSMSSYTWKPLILLSVVCASMMIGHATAVYYVCVSWVRRFAKLKPCEKFVFRFLEPIRKIFCPRKNVNVYGTINLHSHCTPVCVCRGCTRSTLWFWAWSCWGTRLVSSGASRMGLSAYFTSPLRYVHVVWMLLKAVCVKYS